MLSNYFRNSSIQEKLRVVLVMNTTIALTVISISFFIYQYMILKDSVVSETSTLSQTLSTNLTAPVIFNDKDSAQNILNSLKYNQGIAAAFVLNDKNELVASFSHPNYRNQSVNKLSWEILKPDLVKFVSNPKEFQYTDNGIHFKSNIKIDRDMVGTLHIYHAIDLFRNRILDYILFGSIFLLSAGIVALVLSFKMQRIFTDPIIAIKNKMQEVTQTKNYDQRVNIKQNDELGELVQVFNSMLFEINSREQNIQKNQQLLESEVKSRTQELSIANNKLEKIIVKSQHDKEMAENASQAKSMFVANMSHELRTPLNGVLGMIEVLLKSELTEKQKNYLQIANSSADTLLGVINDVLDFSKIEANQLMIEKEPINLREIIERVSLQFAERAESKGIELRLDLTPDFDGLYLGDELRVKQILNNLISNALKFTEKGNITVKLKRYPHSQQSDYVDIDVIDSGCGIKQEKLDKIFLPFSQEDDSTSRVYGGTGLGLSITRKLVELMDGQISATSEVGQGTTFSMKIIFPYQERDVLDAFNKPDFADTTALIIDDDPFYTHFLQQHLEAWKIDCTLETTLENGLEKLKKHADNIKFDLLITNQSMSQVSGLNLLKKLKGNPALQQPKKLLLISILKQLTTEELFEADVSAAILKPIQKKDLLNTVNKLVYGSEESNQGVIKPAGKQKATFSGRRILVAEDNPVNQELAKIMLESFGCSVQIANNGQEALAIFKKENFDLILMDCQMPLVDGYHATQNIRTFEDSLDSYVPIVALTANATNEDKDKCIACGMNDYLVKPYSEKDIHEMLCSWLEPSANSLRDEKAKSFDSVPADNKLQAFHNNNLLKSKQPIMIDKEVLDNLAQITKDQNANMIAKLIDLYIDTMDDKLAQFQLPLTEQDMTEVHNMAHMLKSSSANIGATAITENFRQLEAKSAQQDIEASSLLLNNILENYKKVKPQLIELKGQYQ